MKRFFAEHKQYLLIIGSVVFAFMIRNFFMSDDNSTDLKAPNLISADLTKAQTDEELGIYYAVDVAPRFPGCENQATTDEKKKCADQKMLRYLYEHLVYPPYAREHDIEGRCVITFVVESDGLISNAKILRDIGGGCGEESLKVINSMNELPEKWIPGIHHGDPARVRFNMPINFRLEPEKEPENR